MQKIKSLIIILCFSTTQFAYGIDESSVTTEMTKQKTACTSNSAKEWNSKLNRCVGKQEAIDTRNEAKSCNAIEDLRAREKCHLSLAEKKTKLSSDPNSLSQGNLGKSAIMNGVGTAYTVLGMINGMGSGKKESKCMSKKIFGITAMAGTATDIWLKIRAKKKMDSLAGKYKLEKTQNPYDAQVKALHYLKEEQETVEDIASAEKKRNMLLMLGYGAATAMAIYEMATYVTSSQCYVKDSDSKAPENAPKQPAVKVEEAVPNTPEAPPVKEVAAAPVAPAAPETTVATVVPDAPAAAVVPETPVAVSPPPAPAPVTPAPPAEPVYRFADPAKPGSYDPSVYDRAQEMLKRNGLKRSDLDDNRLQILYDNSHAYLKFELNAGEVVC